MSKDMFHDSLVMSMEAPSYRSVNKFPTRELESWVVVEIHLLLNHLREQKLREPFQPKLTATEVKDIP
jgi:hypothetical protein